MARRRETVRVLCVLLLASLALAAAEPARTGSPAAAGAVVGTVTVRVASAAPPTVLSPYARPRYRPPARAERAPDSPESVVVYLRGEAPPPAGPRATAHVVQRGRTIIPHVTAVEAGTRVEFPNEDDVFHNIFSLSGPRNFNLGRYPPGESRAVVFDRPGVVRLFCDIHSEMGGVILVLDTPYFTRPEEDGTFRIEGVPNGAYTAYVWHEVAGLDSTRVVVAGDAETRVDFVLGG